MEVVPAVTPVASLPFPDRGDDITAVFSVVLVTHGDLPADIGLPVHVPFPGLHRGDVECATGAALEARGVVEDAGTVDHASLHVLTLADLPFSVGTLVEVLPVAPLQPLHVLGHRLQVVLVEEVGTVRAATLHQLGSRVVMDALATLPVDALVVGAEERCIDHPCPEFLGILETDPLPGFFFTWHGRSVYVMVCPARRMMRSTIVLPEVNRWNTEREQKRLPTNCGPSRSA